MENLDFDIFQCNFINMVFTEIKLWFLSSFEHFWPDPQDTLSKVALFCKKMYKVLKNKTQGCCTPLISSTSTEETPSVSFSIYKIRNFRYFSCWLSYWIQEHKSIRNNFCMQSLQLHLWHVIFDSWYTAAKVSCTFSCEPYKTSS